MFVLPISQRPVKKLDKENTKAYPCIYSLVSSHAHHHNKNVLTKITNQNTSDHIRKPVPPSTTKILPVVPAIPLDRQPVGRRRVPPHDELHLGPRRDHDRVAVDIVPPAAPLRVPRPRGHHRGRLPVHRRRVGHGRRRRRRGREEQLLGAARRDAAGGKD